MASGNLFLGQARRSVGDVTFYRTRGVQRSRVRVRQIANPRSFAQMRQRAVVANISRLYSIGRELFDHSYQGYKQGQDNQLRFQRVNISRLQNLIASDITEGRTYYQAQGRVGARGLAVPVPFVGLQVSEGSLLQDYFTYREDSAFYVIPSTASDTQTVAEYAAAHHLVAGDIYTFGSFVIVNTAANAIVNYSVPGGILVKEDCIFPCSFSYVQLMVKDGLDAVTTPAVEAKLPDIFDIVGPAASKLDSFILGDSFDAQLFSEDNIGPIFLIKSKYGQDLRSTSFVVPGNAPSGQSGSMPYGLTYHNIARAWGDTQSQADVTEILDGSDFDE